MESWGLKYSRTDDYEPLRHYYCHLTMSKQLPKKKKQTNSCKLYIERSVFVETTKQMCSTIENKRSSMVYLVQT